jgi:hypothetical protein
MIPRVTILLDHIDDSTKKVIDFTIEAPLNLTCTLFALFASTMSLEFLKELKGG